MKVLIVSKEALNNNPNLQKVRDGSYWEIIPKKDNGSWDHFLGYLSKECEVRVSRLTDYNHYIVDNLRIPFFSIEEITEE